MPTHLRLSLLLLLGLELSSCGSNGTPAAEAGAVFPEAAAAGGQEASPADANNVGADAISPKSDHVPSVLGELKPSELNAMLAAKDFLLIDVHYPNAGSLPGTDARIAFDDIPALVEFIGPNLDTKVVLTCLSAHMSKDAGDQLMALGYRNICELTGGTNAWTSAGYTLVRLDGGL